MKIEHYEFGRITVEGKSYSSDVIICPEGVEDSWWRERGHEVSCADLEPVLEADPEVLIIGTGAHGLMKVLPEAQELLREHRIAAHEEPTGRAVQHYNKLLETGQKRVVAALHLTC